MGGTVGAIRHVSLQNASKTVRANDERNQINGLSAMRVQNHTTTSESFSNPINLLYPLSLQYLQFRHASPQLRCIFFPLLGLK